MEGVNALHLEGLPEPVDFVTVDVSFISLRLALPVVRELILDSGRRGAATSPDDHPDSYEAVRCGCAPTRPATGSIVVLFKPQFEAARDEVPRGGVIRFITGGADRAVCP
jgi:23S rRNA (cytidine1920-2'-O)/16S rRNA (cytidine1409-2'-O)-methyltransferase